jgi:hypothetical protein
MIGPCGCYRTVQDEGVAVARERILNFIGGSVTVTDDPANSRTNVTISGGGSGIQFDVDNEGGFLRVFAEGDDGEGNGIWLDASDATNGRILITSEERDVELRAGRDINILPEGDLFASAPNGDATVRCVSGNMRLIGGTSVQVTSASGGVTIEADGGEVNLIQAPGTSLFVRDSGGAPMFQVDSLGNLHGVTGRSLVFDL